MRKATRWDTRGLVFALVVGAVAVAQPDPEIPASPFEVSITIERNDKTIKVQKYGPDDSGAAIICPAKDDDPDKITTTVYADVLPYRVHITINDNTILSPVAFVQKKDKGDGRLEAYDGTVKENPSENECLPIIAPAPKAGTVLVRQGKTRLTGSKLIYDEMDGLAVVSGPIEFERPQAKDTLRGNSDKITIEVDNEKTILEGNVQLTTRCRTSFAERVEYDDLENKAVLYGKPARSVQSDGKSEISGEVIEYNLETNDVIVTSSENGIVGKLDDSAAPCE